MTSSPRVSVVITTYNRPQLLVDALTSVRKQTFPDYEIIVVNDHPGSVEQVVEVVSEFDVRLLSPDENLGPSAARNLGLSEASGEIVAHLDDDDMWLPDYLQRHVERHEECPTAVVVYSGHVKESSALGLAPRLFLASPPPDDTFTEMLSGRFTLASNSIASIKSSAIRTVGGFDTSLTGVEDWDLMVRLAQQGEFAHVAEALTIYREHAEPRSSVGGRDLTLKAAESKWAEYPQAAEFFRRVRGELVFNHSRLAGLAGSRGDAWRAFRMYLKLGKGLPGYHSAVLKLLLLNTAGPSVYRRIHNRVR